MYTEEGWNGQTEVYGLIDPRTHRMMYVGTSVDWRKRTKAYDINSVACDGNNDDIREWLSILSELGLKPVIGLLIECEGHSNCRIEKELIRRFDRIGQCELNRVKYTNHVYIENDQQIKHRFDRTWRELEAEFSGRSRTDAPLDRIESGWKVKRAEILITEIANDLGRMPGAKRCDRALRIMRLVMSLEISPDDTLRDRFPVAYSDRVFLESDESDAEMP